MSGLDPLELLARMRERRLPEWEGHVGWKNLLPAEELWPFPEPLPLAICLEMPGEATVELLFEGFWGQNPPKGWTRDHARALVNRGRQRLFRLYKEVGG